MNPEEYGNKVAEQFLTQLKMYIAVLNEVPDHMVPVCCAHASLAYADNFKDTQLYRDWHDISFKKCIVSVGKKEFEKIKQLPNALPMFERSTLNATESYIAIIPPLEIPNVLKFAKLWRPIQ